MFQVQTAGDFVSPGPAQVLATGGTRTNTQHPVLPAAAPRRLDASMAFWAALADRYMPGGALAHAEHWRDGYGVRYFEVENEPDTFPWVSGTWSNVPKDFALYLSMVHASLRARSPGLHVVGPALSSGPDGTGCCGGLTWLDQVLRTGTDLQWASDDYRAAVRAGQPVVGGGPFIDVYSFHDDSYDAASTYSTDRAAAVRGAITALAGQPRYPTSPNPVVWETEGGPTRTDAVEYAREQAQVTVRLLAAGVQRLNLDTAGMRGDSPEALATDPIARQVATLVRALPSGAGMAPQGGRLTASSGHPVEAYAWSDPASHTTSWILWAVNEPSGSHRTGEVFDVAVPVRPGRVRVTLADWSDHELEAGSHVRVTLQSGDPSGITIVTELPS
jgi:hypothetical protein